MNARLDRRRRTHGRLSARLAALSDEQIAALAPAAGEWRASVHGNQTGVIDLGDAKVFAKKIALTDRERAPGNAGATANLFDLPTFYHYGVGSSGFGAWRELQASLRASEWALPGECAYFPLAYHWRVLPRTPPRFSGEQLAWLEQAPAYWDNSDAVRARLAEIAAASAAIVIFLEYVPETLRTWLSDRLSPRGIDAALEASILRAGEQLNHAAAFMNARGMLHFDLNAFNVLTDGEQIYAADFGLAICHDFDLSSDERAFFEAHRLYDRAYLPWALAEWLAPGTDPPALTPMLSASLDRASAVAKVFGRFLARVSVRSKTTPFPAAELEAALAALSPA